MGVSVAAGVPRAAAERQVRYAAWDRGQSDMPHAKVSVLLRDAGVLRSFYWFALGPDGSIYFGTLCDFTRRGVARFDCYSDGEAVEREHLEMLPVERDSKHSLHLSGELLGPQVHGRRRSQQTLKAEAYVKVVPLVGVMPMAPLVYPHFLGSTEPHHITLDTDAFQGRPFSFLAFLERAGSQPLFVAPPPGQWDTVVQETLPLGTLQLHALIYSRSPEFSEWPEVQEEIVAREARPGGSLLVLLFGSMP